MNNLRVQFALACLLVFAGAVQAQDDMAALSAQGKELYFKNVSCWVCHGDKGEGRVGPTLLTKTPTPLDIQEQLDSNPQMAIITSELDPSIEDLLALSVYIGELGGHTVSPAEIGQWRSELTAIRAARSEEVVFPVSARDQQILDIQHFDTVLADWQRKAKTGSLKRDYDAKVLATYEAGVPAFTPEPGKLYFYENTGRGGPQAADRSKRTDATQVVVGDAQTKEIIAYGEMPVELRGAVHTSVITPDGRYAYIIGPSSTTVDPMAGGGSILRTPATLLKVDALTLKPVKQLSIGGRLHHAQIFQDKYILMDTFISDPGGLDVFLFDPETDQIVGGISTRDLGGSNYTAYTDHEFIYVLMQPGNDGGSLRGAALVAEGELTALRPYWVAKIDPTNWEVVAEYPYRGYRGDWITIDSKSEYLYIPAAGSSNLTKINNKTGAIEWSKPTGIGPYGAALTADESEIWVANKGEATGHIGRTITVMDAKSGRSLDTLFSGYAVDHVLLSPDGKEMWATSNGEGRIYVFDAETREQKTFIDMPGYGAPHGLVWVQYDDDGSARVVRDQGGFHGGVHPAR